jgi:hypothetical protein
MIKNSINIIFTWILYFITIFGFHIENLFITTFLSIIMLIMTALYCSEIETSLKNKIEEEENE